MINKISVIIIENEKEAQDYLISLIEKVELDVEVLGVFSNVKDSLKGLETYKPEIVFMDIELDDGNAFDILNAIENYDFEVVFITAFNDYLEKVLEYCSFQFIKKPFDFETLKSTLFRYYKIQKRFLTKSKFKLYKEFNESSKLLLNVGVSHVLIDINKVIKCEANGNYTLFFMSDGEKHVASKALKFYDEILSYKNFFRANRFVLVNVNYVKSIYKREALILKNKDKIVVSVRNRTNLNKMIKNLLD
ncbi:LytR/AlgR family response regulator transcription factor [Tenacibaculum jejuense]|uniref:Putative Sensory transduction protein LytT n=1 Tax=Tenacibaculum jejuense TaxID=584609 RepID=A0A238UE69_9FLAO|nr:LytTR family DNA-binding domain-containing protein [Tenacibaculum jejuense]SNR17451.1 putative Sensory transduction protein LytT [Tenacibaculum jejuense]